MRLALGVLVILAVWTTTVCSATAPEWGSADPRPREILNAAELKLALRKLQVTGTALYVAAHPDDENSAFLSYLSRERLVRSVYLSMTRGDGGQNLLGLETGEALGVIRTHELLAARRIDGAEQVFTRAIDFGYSKNPEETLEIWGRERILADAVWAIRRLRPDVIVTRFGTDGSGGHGHHTSSAILAGEAFRAAADPARFPEQLAWVKPWQAKRVLWNNWRAKLEGRDPALPRILTVDLGRYNPLLGRAYSEIAGQSRSMHKSQGFGAPERRGPIPNHFEHVDGAPARADLFDDVDLTWARFKGGAAVGALLREAERTFDPDQPAAIVPRLLKAHAAMGTLEPEPLIEAKRRDLQEVIRSCAGLWVEAIAASPTVTPGSALGMTLTVLNRSETPIRLERVELPAGATTWLAAGAGADSGARPEAARPALGPNQPIAIAARIPVPADQPLSQPLWLRARPLEGSFQIDDPAAIGRPDSPAAFVARVVLSFGGESLGFEVPVVHRWTDPVQGERYRLLEVVPPATCRFDQNVLLFPDARPREIRLVVESADSTLSGVARLGLPSGWRADPAEQTVRFAERGVQELRFSVTPPAGAATGVAAAEIEIGGRVYGHRMQLIDYPHLPIQTLFPPAEARLVRADVRHTGEQIGYLMGSGDEVPEALRQMGFKVTLLSDDEVEQGDLSRFDAIVAGVRVYNTRPRLRTLQPRLLDYVKGGGRLVVQYSTSERGLENRLGPFPFTISRERVSQERAEMRLRQADHPSITLPNRIGPDDFAGWVQERGLYYASPFDPRYETPLSANDAGEPARDGGLLFARHGKGVFVYTGLAFFRQLPAGVPGAYRLFANLVSAPSGS